MSVNNEQHHQPPISSYQRSFAASDGNNLIEFLKQFLTIGQDAKINRRNFSIKEAKKEELEETVRSNTPKKLLAVAIILVGFYYGFKLVSQQFFEPTIDVQNLQQMSSHKHQ